MVRETLTRVFTNLKHILELHGGTVEKFIGDAVMAVFGVPVAHDDDAERAVRAAFRCREAIDDLNPGSTLPLRLRIGVNSGEAVADTERYEQFLVTGTPVNVAARLQQAALPGEILVGAVTRDLTHGRVAYADAREVHAQGVGTIEAWAASRLISPLSEDVRVRTAHPAALVGRDAELQLLREEWARVERDRRPSLVTISGAPGVGKSRLISEFAEGLGPGRTFVGRCLPYGEGITLWPIQQILRSEMGIELEDDNASVVRKLRERLAYLVADVRERDALTSRLMAILGLAQLEGAPPSVALRDVGEELRWGVRRYFERAVRGQACMLVFEDVHRAEAGLLELIAGLSESGRAPLLLVCLARPEFTGVRGERGAKPVREIGLTLEPLSDGDIDRLITDLLGARQLSMSTRSAVIARAEGNPLYVEELLRAIGEAAASARRGAPGDEGPSEGLELPATLQGLITARLDRLPADVKALLHRASLVGRLFSTAALEAIGGTTVRRELLAEAVRRELLVETLESAPGGGDTYRFKHVLIRDVTYGTVPKSERARMHDNYGRWLELTFGDRHAEVIEIVAHHAEQAFLLAKELGRPEADALGRRALGLLNDVARRARQRQDDAAVGLYQRAAAVASAFADDLPAYAEALGGLAVARYWRYGEREPLERALELSSAMAGSETMVLLLVALGYANFGAGKSEVYLGILDSAVAAAKEGGDPDVIAEALGVRANAAYQSGDPASYVRLVDEAIAYARGAGATRELPRLLLLRYIMATREARFAIAFSIEEELEASFPPPSLSSAAVAWDARRTALRQAVGDSEAALAVAEASTAVAREHASPIILGVHLWHLGDVVLELGQCERARDALSEAVALFTRLGQRGQIPEVSARCARARIRLADLEGARRDLDVASAAVIASDAESRSIIALAGGELAQATGDSSLADQEFRLAISLLDTSIFRTYLAQARVVYGRFLLSERRIEDAKRELSAALAIYDEPLAHRRRTEIDTLLRECG